MPQQSFEPVKIGRGEVVEEEREPLFYLDEEVDGDVVQVEYTIPKKIRPNIVIKYLNDCADRGQEVALGRAMQEVLGADAMEALAESDDVTDEQMQRIMDIIERKLEGQMKRSLGKSRNGRRR